MMAITSVKSLCWHLLGKRPQRLNRFGGEVVRRCLEWRPGLLLTTGLAPSTAKSLATAAGRRHHHGQFPHRRSLEQASSHALVHARAAVV